METNSISLLIEKKASEFRQGNRLNLTSPVSLPDLLDDLNVITLLRPLSDKFSGMALKVGDLRFMLINTSSSIGRQNFTIAHELYHLYIQDYFTSRTCNPGMFKFDKADPEEFKADVFAANLLMPYEGILKYIPEDELPGAKKPISLDTVILLEQKFKVSRTAILYRLKLLKFITPMLFTQYRADVKYTARQRGYDDTLYSPTYSTQTLGDGEYKRLARKFHAEGTISEMTYATLLKDLGFDIFREDKQPERNTID